MQRVFQIFFLCLCLLLAVQPLFAQTLAGSPSDQDEEKRVRMPVEVIGTGGQREWVMVEVSNEMIPEPGSAALLALSSLLLLRRQRGK